MSRISEMNVGGIDRLVRLAVGVAIFSLAFVGPKTVFAVLGLIPFVTGALGYCPLYKLTGITTCPLPRKS